MVTTTFYIREDGKLSDKLSDKLFVIIGNSPEITINEMAGLLGVSERVIRYNLQKLIESGRIVRGGAWEYRCWKV